MATCFELMRADERFKKLSDDELKSVVDNNAAILEKSKNKDEYLQKFRNYVERQRIIRADEVKTRVVDNRVFAARLNEVRAAPADKKHKALIGIFQGKNSLQSTEASYLHEAIGVLDTGLQVKEVREAAISGVHERDMLTELINKQNKGTAPVTKNETAQVIADAFNKFFNRTFEIQKLNDMPLHYLEGRGHALTHDGHAMRADAFDEPSLLKARGEWKASILEMMDVDRVFGADADNAKLIDKELNEFFDYKVNNIPMQKTGLTGGSRMFHPKDADALIKYREKYGLAKTTMQAAFMEAQSASKNAAIANKLGIDFRKNFPDLIAQTEKDLMNNPKALEKFRNKKDSIMNVYKDAIGDLNADPGSVGASVGRNIRAVESMAKLGTSFPPALAGDLVMGAFSARNNNGKSFLGNLFDLSSEFLTNVSPEKRKEATALLGFHASDMLGEYMSKLDMESASPGFVSDMTKKFMKLNLMDFENKGIKNGAGKLASVNLAKYSGMTLEKLSKLTDSEGRFTYESIKKYNFSEGQWSLLKNAKEKLSDGLEGVSTTKLGELPDNIYKDAMKLDGFKGSLEKYKLDATTKVRGHYVDMGLRSANDPTFSDRQTFVRGTKAGTIAGEVTRFVAQFKPVMVATLRNLGENVITEAGTPIPGTNVKADLHGLTAFMISATALSYVAMTAKDTLVGKTPRDPTDPKTLMEAFIQSGSMGLYGSFLAGEYDKRYRSVLKDLAGPTLSQLDDLGEIWANARKGDFKAGQALHLLINNTPGHGLPLIQMGFNYMFLYDLQEHLSHGWARNLEKAAKEKKQRYYDLASPTRIVQ